jgi:hypothetical protein
VRKPHSIPPFPPEIDRNHFASWLSGFTDGEGSFVLLTSIRERCVVCIADFSISLRADDSRVLHLMQSFFQCGNMSRYECESYRRRAIPLNANPRCTFRVNRLQDLTERIIPHFLAYPLIAKKARDFAIWKEAVELQYRIQNRPRRPLYGRRGTKSKWTAAEHEQFENYMNALRSQREYEANAVSIPKSVLQPEEPDLFTTL